MDVILQLLKRKANEGDIDDVWRYANHLEKTRSAKLSLEDMAETTLFITGMQAFKVLLEKDESENSLMDIMKVFKLASDNKDLLIRVGHQAKARMSSIFPNVPLDPLFNIPLDPLINIPNIPEE